jgi:hypothetical protein
MRRHALFIGMLFGSLTWLTPSLPAQDAGAAARQEIEENIKHLNGQIENLTAAQELMQKSINKLKEDVARLAEDATRASDRNKESASAESLKQLKSAIEEVDAKRLSDQKKVLEKFDNLNEIIKKLLDKSTAPKGTTPAPPPPRNGNGHSAKANTTVTPPSDTPPAGRENMFKYQIQDGDTLSLIVTELRKKGMKITQKQVMDANPTVNWTKLKINQTIYIPAPAP